MIEVSEETRANYLQKSREGYESVLRTIFIGTGGLMSGHIEAIDRTDEKGSSCYKCFRYISNQFFPRITMKRGSQASVFNFHESCFEELIKLKGKKEDYPM